ncbi:hypothetical protein [Flavobacterium kingsejongi]|uniref:Outer membrane protein beta-barrel domain-containing protein n=1 Tax=Flavobacterium kingsejongi TaxID=1678728 RepID=A0A2S1LJL1_9FLAO|nr:hypothetical protein [Flavobacterium kingsejongi]AWG23938.1 hypothetical protein FK004_01225 [Flavobacterium kingsejongi]
MRNLTVYLSIFLCLFLTKIYAQDFETRAKTIGDKIESITKEEKAALKEEIDAINQQLESGKITAQAAEQSKKDAAVKRAESIERRVALEESKLTALVKNKVDGTLVDSTKSKKHSFTFNYDSKKKDSVRVYSRTTSQLVFALGANNLATDGAIANSDFRYWGSHFYEWGISYNTRLLKNNNLLHVKYGLSLQYNNLRATDNRFFVENGDQTNLETSAIHLKDSRLRNVNLVVPVYLEFDFGKKEVKGDKTYFKIQQGFRLGLGGFAGANIKTKQILDYEINGNDVEERTRGSFNTNDFVYGLGAYVGYKSTSLYLKYDLNPLFENNTVDQNNISLGLRFDFN